ncbi:50S ribosomal protein L11 methyltransferase [Vicingus serpentipes]|jgi:ribosomal protein L11 methyltransferase|uniref:Ribosomal protein L11 methyltransferase n=1 Tax=Vicingus serpentipes TaxID=1926625 RepID=A0A5C6RWP7_9FLAO|nr:50S ribosomal protein L11 methyltransferase [Vicingus serpentipes]TXB66030.1 50S ribosomal protein L11 methyltransferase [Vicingus serpentipes]
MNYIELSVEISPLEIGREITVAELAELGFESFDDFDKGVKAYIQEDEFSKEAVKEISIFKNEEFKVNYTINLIEDKNWNEVWELSFEPINVNNQCFIRAPFHEVRNDIQFNIEIEPKMSFGTGHHETTHLMIEELLEMEMDGKNVLDMGCGTGVLAILAEFKNAKNICAIDIDEWAYENTIENISRNNCKKIEALKGGAELLNNKKFDIIIANINRNILLNDMETYLSCLKENGDLLLSGFFSSDKEILLDEAKKYDAYLSNENNKNDWTLLHLKRN